MIRIVGTTVPDRPSEAEKSLDHVSLPPRHRQDSTTSTAGMADDALLDGLPDSSFPPQVAHPSSDSQSLSQPVHPSSVRESVLSSPEDDAEAASSIDQVVSEILERRSSPTELEPNEKDAAKIVRKPGRSSSLFQFKLFKPSQEPSLSRSASLPCKKSCVAHHPSSALTPSAREPSLIRSGNVKPKRKGSRLQNRIRSHSDDGECHAGLSSQG